MMRVNRDETAPLRTPMMVGCAFTVDREFFFEIGAYDAGMNIWGSENLEMALRVWQCGGLLEIIPCSHVGHLFRVSTYSFLGNEDTIKAKNNIRLTDVWLDHGKEFYLAVDPRMFYTQLFNDSSFENCFKLHIHVYFDFSRQRRDKW